MIAGFAPRANAVELPITPIVSDCVEVGAPDPIEFEANVAKIGTISATFKWFEDTEGTWTLKMDKNPLGGVETWVSVYPAGWTVLFKKPVTLPQTIVENECIVPEVPVVETGNGGTPPTFAGSSTEPKFCGDSLPGSIANTNVVKGVANDGKAEVQWSIPTNAGNAHIIYSLTWAGSTYWYGLLNTPNDGNEIINDLDTKGTYTFYVAGVNGCAVGPFSNGFTSSN